MTLNELNTLTGIEFNESEYAILDAAYLASGLEKEAFCDNLKNVNTNPAFAALLQVSQRKDASVYPIACRLIDRSVELDNEEMARTAIELIGQVQFLAYKVKKGYHLYRKDREALLDIVGSDRLLQILEESGQDA